MVWAALLVYAAVDINRSYFRVRWTNAHLVREVGIVGYVLYDLVSTTVSLFDDIEDVDAAPYNAWLTQRRESLHLSTPSGEPTRKHVVFLQLESVDHVTLDMTLDGEPAMPFLKGLTERGLSFDHVLDQTGTGRSADAHVLVLTSQIPIQNEAIFTRYDLAGIRSLPRILGQRGWTSMSFEGYHAEFWRWKPQHQALGFDHSYSMTELDDSDMLGWGISDRSVVLQATEKMAAAPDPVFCHILLLTHHHPFHWVRDHLELPGRGLANDYMVSARYVDSVIALLYERLEALGMADDTIVAVYSDHDSGATLELNEHLGREYTDERINERIPLIITGLGPETIGVRVRKPSGLQDLAPTVLTALNVPIPTAFVGIPAQSPIADVILNNGTRVRRLDDDGRPVVEALPDDLDIGTLTRLAIQRPDALVE